MTTMLCLIFIFPILHGAQTQTPTVTPVSGEVRLAGGSDTAGRVEVYWGGEWGTVCDNGWGIEDANIVCNQLGFPGALSAPSGAAFGEGSGPVHYDYVGCFGGEPNLNSCSRSATVSCQHDQDASVSCFEEESTVAPVSGEVRLAGGSDTAGRVEVYWGGEWGTVCDNGWGIEDANIVCNQLGFPGALSAPSGAAFGEGSGPVHYDYVGCFGGEPNLNSCSRSATVSCQHDQDASVSCFEEESTVAPGTVEVDGNVRLVGGNDTSGRVEVYNDGVWGTVCNYGWGLFDGHVVCRQLGFRGAVEASDVSFGPGVDPIHLSFLECVGNEANLLECPYDDGSFCGHSDDAGVVCLPHGSSGGVLGEIRLADGNDTAGRVEVYDKGEWGTVCDNFWDIEDANIVCNFLGFPRALSAIPGAAFGEGSGPVLYDYVGCFGGEPDLYRCSKSSTVSCQHDQDASVVCLEESTVTPGTVEVDGNVRLVGGNDTSGRVEVYNDGVWGTVCNYGWGLFDGHVVCRQLGFRGAVEASDVSFGPGVDPIHLSFLECVGNEANLLECPHDDGSFCGHSDDAGVVCLPHGSSGGVLGEIRLAGLTATAGRVEVYDKGEWGTVCDNGWDIEDANIVCNFLGFPRAVSALSGAIFGEGSGPVHYDYVGCFGGEPDLFRCSKSATVSCQHDQDASVVCLEEESTVTPGGTAQSQSLPPPTCEPLQSSLCGGMPYNLTVFPNAAGFATQEEAEGILSPTFQSVISLGCPPGFFQFMCLQFMPPCDSTGVPTLPCKELCETGFKECVTIMEASGVSIPPLDLDCSLFPAEESGFCFAGDPSRYPYEMGVTAQPPPPPTCEPLQSSSCGGMPYNLTVFPNAAGFTTQEEAEGIVSLTFEPVIPLGCSPGFFQFMCLQFMPPCDSTGVPTIPCKELCETDLKDCIAIMEASGVPVPLDLDCSLLPAEATGLCFAGDPSRYPYEMVSGEVHLAGGNDTAGRVEVYWEGEWGTVCDNGWDIEDANIVCNQLGFPRALSALPGAAFGEGSGPVHYDYVGCFGGEPNLKSCSRSATVSCQHDQDASVVCLEEESTVTPVSGEVRLAGGSDTAGRVEVYWEGEWGTVCDNGWDIEDANIVCNQLGFPRALSAPSGAAFGEGSGPVHYDYVGCFGGEPNLKSCSRSATVSCQHDQDASVVCLEEESTVTPGVAVDGNIRLVGGNDTSGRVEVYIGGVWGTVCNDRWNTFDGHVVCRQLGFRGAVEARDVSYGPGVDPIHLSELDCLGNEANLLECPYVQPDIFCSHDDDAGVVCLPPGSSGGVLGEIRLAGGTYTAGRVEVYDRGEWGTVCDNGWDIEDANIVCNFLGFPRAVSALSGAIFGEGSGPVHYDYVACFGGEPDLFRCSKSATVSCQHDQDASVVCLEEESTVTPGGTTQSLPPPTCEPLQSSSCGGMPYNLTVFPNVAGFTTQEEAEGILSPTFETVIPLGCPAGYFQFMCLQFMPPCDSTGVSTIPCKELCETGFQECLAIMRASGMSILFDLDCSILPAEESGLCFAGDPSRYPYEMGGTTQSLPPPTCEPLQSSSCGGMPYNLTVFPNAAGFTTQEEAEGILSVTFEPVIPLGCPPGFFQFMCLQFMPPCDSTGVPTIPCKELCETDLKDCIAIMEASGVSVPLDLDCSLFPAEESGLCFAGDPSRYPYEMGGTTQSLPPPTCEPLQSSSCGGMPYNQTVFPNAVGFTTQEEAEGILSLTFEPVIPLGCPPGFFQFMCLQFMPPCDSTGVPTIPCKELCETGFKECITIMEASGVSIPPLDLDCSLLPAEESGLCFAGDPSRYPYEMGGTTQSLPPPTCEPLQSSSCRGMPYNQTVFPNSVGFTTQEEAEGILSLTFEPVIPLGCPPGFFQFMCLLFIPPCDSTGVPTIPCKELCETGFKECTTIMADSGIANTSFDFDCSQFPAEESGLCFAGDPSRYPYEMENTLPTTLLLTQTPLMTETSMSTDTLMTTEPSEASEASESTEALKTTGPLKTTKREKTTHATEPAKPSESTESPSTLGARNAAGGRKYTGAIVGVFIFLVAICFVILAVYVVIRRRMRDNEGFLLSEDNNGDSFKNPVYGEGRDYQIL